MAFPIEQIFADLADGGGEPPDSRLIDLSNLKSEEVKLFEQAWSGTEPQLRQQVISKLVDLAEDNIELNFDSIFISCLRDADAEVRSKAIEGLWESEEASLVNLLIDMLEHDISEKVQATAATALGKFAMLTGLNKLRPCYISSIEQALLAAIDGATKSVEVRCRALEAAAPLNFPEVKRAIMEAYQSQNIELRISSIYAMGVNCDPAWLPILLKELTSADVEMRYEATKACGELGEEVVVSYLSGLINDPSDEVALTAVQAIGNIGGSEARDFLEQCLSNPEESIIQAAEQALKEMEAEEDLFHFRA
ncbi:HEAT repeat domain-containing protein [Chloroflexota bacterium]